MLLFMYVCIYIYVCKGIVGLRLRLLCSVLSVSQHSWVQTVRFGGVEEVDGTLRLVVGGLSGLGCRVGDAACTLKRTIPI